MSRQLARGLVHGFELRAGQFELAARLERDRAAAGDVVKADHVRPFHDGIPAENELHAFEQRANAARALVRHGAVPFEREGELLVLSTDAKLRLRPDALRNPSDELVPPLDWRQVDLITRHAGESRGKWAATLHAVRHKGQCGPLRAQATALRAVGGKRP